MESELWWGNHEFLEWVLRQRRHYKLKYLKMYLSASVNVRNIIGSKLYLEERYNTFHRLHRSELEFLDYSRTLEKTVCSEKFYNDYYGIRLEN